MNFYGVCIHEYFRLVLCWEVCPLLGSVLYRRFRCIALNLLTACLTQTEDWERVITHTTKVSTAMKTMYTIFSLVDWLTIGFEAPAQQCKGSVQKRTEQTKAGTSL